MSTMAPADGVLELLRARGLDYRAAASPCVWVAQCPSCRTVANDALNLVVTERGRGGSVSLWCRRGCDGPQIKRLLTAAPADPWEFINELLVIAHHQQRLLRDLLDGQATDLRVAA